MGSSPDKVMLEGNIGDDDECLSILQDVQGDINDVTNYLDDKDYGKALEELDDLQEKIDAVHVYLTTKAKE